MNRRKTAPLAERRRPKTLDDVVGQAHLLGEGRPLRNIIPVSYTHLDVYKRQYSWRIDCHLPFGFV